MRFLLAAILVCGARGQALNIRPAQGARGEGVAIEVALDSAPADGPATIKWELVYPAQLLEADLQGPEIGSAAQAAAKSLTCVPRGSYSYVCILTGGAKPVSNGPVAKFPFKIRKDARTGETVLRLTKITAVDKDSKTLIVNGGEGLLEIH